MRVPEVDIRLEQTAYAPGDTLAGAFAVEDDPDARLRTLELSVLWYTEGKGDEDLGVILYQEWPGAGGEEFDLGRPHAFSVGLPPTPWSYDGTLVKIHWCVRVRARWAGGEETLGEHPFQLGRAGR